MDESLASIASTPTIPVQIGHLPEHRQRVSVISGMGANFAVNASIVT